jgi:ABC-type Mn2+/Zn2+ transport system permease subunit
MGWAYASASAATVLILSWAATGSSDTLHLLFGNVLAVQASHVIWLAILSAVVVAVHLVFGRRFLLVTFDPDGAMVAGVHTRGWNLLLNLTIGVAAAGALHEIGAPTAADGSSSSRRGRWR